MRTLALVRLRAADRVIGAACLAFLLGACTPTPTTISPGVSPELKHSWEMSFNRGDAGGVAALYAPDAQLVMSGTAPIRGAVDIKHAIEGMIRTGIKVRIDTEQNIGSGDIAYVYGTYLISAGENEHETERGSYVEVWRRLDGVWKIELDVNAAGLPIASATNNQGSSPDTNTWCLSSIRTPLAHPSGPPAKLADC